MRVGYRYTESAGVQRSSRMLIASLAAMVVMVVGDFAAAQPWSKPPEFGLGLTVTFDSHPTWMPQARWIGYDSIATDGTDKVFGETEYPGGGGLGPDFYFVQPAQAGGLIVITDIRAKPKLDSFTLAYHYSLSNPSYPERIHWDPKKLGPNVTEIAILSPDSQRCLGLFTKAGEVVLNEHNYTEFQNGIMLLYYRMTPPQYVLSAVNDAPLVRGAVSAYPNPAHGAASLAFVAQRDMPIRIELCDITGRAVHSYVEMATRGENTFSLPTGGLSPGAYHIRVFGQDGAITESYQTSIVVQR